MTAVLDLQPVGHAPALPVPTGQAIPDLSTPVAVPLPTAAATPLPTSAATPLPTSAATPLPTEASTLGRYVAVLTPLFAVLAGGITSWVARRTGAHLDPAEITALMVSGATAVLAASLKWLQGWQQHELLVAQGRDLPRKPGPTIPR